MMQNDAPSKIIKNHQKSSKIIKKKTSILQKKKIGKTKIGKNKHNMVNVIA